MRLSRLPQHSGTSGQLFQRPLYEDVQLSSLEGSLQDACTLEVEGLLVHETAFRLSLVAFR